MQIFYARKVSANLLELDESEAHHSIKVLRHQMGDFLDIIDGEGTYYKASLENTEGKKAYAKILSSIPDWGEAPLQIQMGVSPLRLKDRFEWLIEKAVELGVTEIFPLQCEHTVPYPKMKQNRLETIILTATKQSKRSRIPKFHPLQKFTDFISNNPSKTTYLAHCKAERDLQSHRDEIDKSNSVRILIGPEGDFSASEIELTESNSIPSVSLGKQRLRTETAAIYALSVVKMLRGY